MADLDWRVWVYDRLVGSSLFTALVPEESIYGGGSLTGPPESKPFVVITLGAENEGVPGASVTDLSLYCHDETGNFNRLTQVTNRAKDALCGPGVKVGPVSDPGGIAVRWQSTGRDLSDEGFGTLVKISEYELIGRNGHA